MPSQRRADAPAAPASPWRIGGLGSPAFVLLLLAVRLVVAVATIEAARTGPMLDTDVQRFEEIATSEGLPYRDFPVEYAPLELLTIDALAGDGAGATASRIAVLWFASEVAVVLALRWGWGMREAGAYLLLGLPIVPLMSLRLDPTTVALATWGAALAVRRRERAGGALIGCAILAKIWPAAILPALWMARRSRSLWWAIGVATAGGVAWIAWAGAQGPRQVGLYRGASGWHIQSTIGALVWIVTGGPLRYERNAERVGYVPGWARLVLAGLTIALIGGCWIRARARRERDPFGRAAIGALGALIGLSPVFSAQYVAWLLPWAAIASTERDPRWLVRTTMLVSALAGITYAVFGVGGGSPAGAHIPVLQALLLATGGCCVALPILWFLEPAGTAAARANAGAVARADAGARP
jgi:hypothetical protein